MVQNVLAVSDGKQVEIINKNNKKWSPHIRSYLMAHNISGVCFLINKQLYYDKTSGMAETMTGYRHQSSANIQ